MIRPTLVWSFRGYPCSQLLLWLIASYPPSLTGLQWLLSCFSSSLGSSVSCTSWFLSRPRPHRYTVLTWVFDQPEEAETGGQYVSLSVFAVSMRPQVVFVVPVGDQLPLHRSLHRAILPRRPLLPQDLQRNRVPRSGSPYGLAHGINGVRTATIQALFRS